jgi:hypothetical protein
MSGLESQMMLFPEDGDDWSCGKSIEDVVAAYRIFLEVCHQDHKERFEHRLVANLDAAKAEAVVFSCLHLQGLNPSLAESTAKGGVDFLFSPESHRACVLEVTSLERKAVERRSGWPDELNEQAQAFSMITPKPLVEGT